MTQYNADLAVNDLIADAYSGTLQVSKETAQLWLAIPLTHY